MNDDDRIIRELRAIRDELRWQEFHRRFDEKTREMDRRFEERARESDRFWQDFDDRLDRRRD